MSVRDELAGCIREIVADVVEMALESDDDDIIEAGRLDSLSLIELIFVIEQDLGVAIALDELDVESFRSVRSIVALVAPLAEQQSVRSGERSAETSESSYAASESGLRSAIHQE